MKLSVSAYRAHASAHKKILDTAYQLNYGSTSASHPHPATGTSAPTTSSFQIDPPPGDRIHHDHHKMKGIGVEGEVSSDDANTPLHSPRSINTSREEDDSSNANESDRSPNSKYNITKSNQRWMKLRTTVQISSAIQSKKPPLKREDSFLQRFSTRQIPETQETVEDTGSEGNPGDNAPRRRRRHRKQPKTVINPDENFYFYWLLAITVSVLYNMWTLIVRQSFPELQEMISGFWLCCDTLSDIVLLLDVMVQLRTGYLEQGLMVYDSKKLACHYLRSRAFLLDLAALCPLDLLQFRFGTHPLLRFPRFLKVYRAVNYYYMVESRTVWPNLWRVVNLIHILLILAHWFGCFYFLLSEAEGFRGDWVYPYRPGDYSTLARKYLGSLYWSTLTLTTIGDLPTPETNAEYVFTIVSYLIGVFIFATIVGQVGNVITNRNANRLEFERLLDGAKTYMRHHKVPGGMKRRVLRWYDYSWSRGRIQGGGDINTALGLLPDKLKTELALHVNLSVLKKVTIFQECQPEFLRDLVLKMKAYIFTPGDSICRKGEVAREMFIIADGILEVLSEHGKVLTTMKAGDFFGEIGILNLDGLNKRTADVRSVGYSELFSLSREDVLAAMKDYPEAQEILQALGRKRLMEVKASARLPPNRKAHHNTHSTPGDPKGLVDKIKNEAKGLRNVLKKTKTHRRSQESLELQPLHMSNNPKGPLLRMSRVRSHDLSQDEEKSEHEPLTEKVSSPLGAGLPLLSRLRLLKEKQDHEERAKSATPPIISPTATNLRSPPLINEEIIEPIGVGLPLLQRILTLKAKEEKAAKIKETLAKDKEDKWRNRDDRANIKGVNKTSGSQPTSPTPLFQKLEGRASFSGVLSRVTTCTVGKRNVYSNKVAHNKITLRERLKLHSSANNTTKDLLKDNSSSVTPTPLDNTNAQQLQLLPVPIDSSASDLNQPPSIDKLQPSIKHYDNDSLEEPKPSLSASGSVGSVSGEVHWSKLKKAAFGGPTEVAVGKVHSSSAKEPSQSTTKRIRPKLVLTGKTKQYRSIDDLSPEYGGLPFVKKLKILNERQKLEELETVIKTRSFSLDIPDNPQMDNENLTRSQSEGCAMHQNRLIDKHHLNAPLTSSPLHSSTESNETPERRNLKSILKKLSEDTQQTQVPDTTMPEKVDSTEFKKLMRAPTIEGYAARHSKLSKSVTFNRDTLQSPPNSAALLGVPQSLFPFVSSPTDNGLECREMERKNEMESIQLVSNQRNQQFKLLKASLDDEQQYFADILLAIKQVMNSHLHDMQQKFHHKYEKMEEELRSKEQIIARLKAHIFELERNNEDSFTSSIETVVSRELHQSWDDPTNEEIEELDDLPQPPLSPLPTWSPPPQNNNVIVRIESTTDSEDESSDEDAADNNRAESDSEYQNTSGNWEIELLAAQMREKRSASLDPNSARPLRRRFTRGFSADNPND